MADRVLASFAHPHHKKASAAVVDTGCAIYLCFYEGVRKKEEVGAAWVFNAANPTPPYKADDHDPPLDPMPNEHVAANGICASAKDHAWALVWTRQREGCVLFYDGVPVVFEDPRDETTYCSGLKSASEVWGWRPLPASLSEQLIQGIQPAVGRKGKRAVFPPHTDISAGYRLELPELPHQRIKYGKPKHIGRIKLADVLDHPIWAGMVEDDRYDEEYERPVTGQTDVDDGLLSTIGTLNPFLSIAARVKGTDFCATGMLLSRAADTLSSIVVWNGKSWVNLNQINSLRAPVTLVAVPAIRGVKNVAFKCRDLSSGEAHGG